MKDPAFEMYKKAKDKRDRAQLESFYFSKQTTKTDIKERNFYMKVGRAIHLHKQGKLPSSFYKLNKNGKKIIDLSQIKKV